MSYTHKRQGERERYGHRIRELSQAECKGHVGLTEAFAGPPETGLWATPQLTKVGRRGLRDRQWNTIP